MPCIVADSSALILLSKCSLLEITCDLFKVGVPSSVIDEVVSEDFVRRYPDAALISDLISKGSIINQDPEPDTFQFPLQLHRGERDALLLALQLADAIIATDDGKAIRAARFLKTPFVITPKIVVDLFRLGKISFKKSRQSIEKLGTIGRYPSEVIVESVLSLMEANNEQARNHKNP